MRKKHLNKKVLLGVCACLLSIAIVLVYLNKDIFFFDNRTSKKDTRSVSELKDEVQKKADENMFRARINSDIVLKNENEEASLYLRNPEENKNDCIVEITSDKTKKTVYSSNELKPGDSVLKAKLKNLDSNGNDAYTAHFKILEDGKQISSIEYAISIKVGEK
ncbi:MAG: hypothetical protein RR500_00885 [Bacilli bacterium]